MVKLFIWIDPALKLFWQAVGNRVSDNTHFYNSRCRFQCFAKHTQRLTKPCTPQVVTLAYGCIYALGETRKRLAAKRRRDARACKGIGKAGVTFAEE